MFIIRKLGLLFIILGIGIGGYVLYGSYQQDKRTEKMVREIEQLGERTVPTSAEASQEEPPSRWVLVIPKIDLTVPVLEGTTEEVLDVAAGKLESSGQLGKKGHNFVVAAHRAYQFGRFFNRLDELEGGDEVLVQSADTTYQFQVSEKKIINPNQAEYLNPKPDHAMLTLLTCHPMYSDSKRLLVFTELQNN
ncbi:sortase A [Bacillus ectoiniformans]|uniref:sortase n=1 Tax=Bacillus ectoiniformans TaxID=1494429 RepID=UPI00195C9575|nr:sortase A [Bacillus ectoiniformans]